VACTPIYPYSLWWTFAMADPNRAFEAVTNYPAIDNVELADADRLIYNYK